MSLNVGGSLRIDHATRGEVRIFILCVVHSVCVGRKLEEREDEERKENSASQIDAVSFFSIGCSTCKVRSVNPRQSQERMKM